MVKFYLCQQSKKKCCFKHFAVIFCTKILMNYLYLNVVTWLIFFLVDVVIYMFFICFSFLLNGLISIYYLLPFRLFPPPIHGDLLVSSSFNADHFTMKQTEMLS